MSASRASVGHTLSAHQPAYLPWLGYFAKMAAADVFVLHDRSRFERHGFLHRNRVKTPEGPRWLTIPMVHEDLRNAVPVDEIRIDDRHPWQRAHRRALEHNYRRTPWFEEYWPLFEAYYAGEYATLGEAATPTVEIGRRLLDVTVPVVRTSERQLAGVPPHDLPLALCRLLGADTYVSGPHGRAYLSAAAFVEAGIGLTFMDFRQPEYRQRFGAFVANLSFVDVVMNCGPAAAPMLAAGCVPA